MLDHFTITVLDLARSLAFYERALAPLGYGIALKYGDFVGFGEKGRPQFWVTPGPTPTQPMHIAFVAKSRKDVDAFHAAALAAGGVDEGAPGLRPQYHPGYYGAFVIDPDGHPIEACCHRPE